MTGVSTTGASESLARRVLGANSFSGFSLFSIFGVTAFVEAATAACLVGGAVTGLVMTSLVESTVV